MSNKIVINIVNGSGGLCINLINDDGRGQRVAGSKPWGNPYNTPMASFEVDADELVRVIRYIQYEK